MNLEDSILRTIKLMLGLTDEITAYDEEIKVHINSLFTILNQLDVISDDGFRITGYDETWDQLTDQLTLAEMIKEFMYLKVRMVFDPPGSSVVSDAYNSRIAELEWRMNIQAERLAALAEKEAAVP